MEKSLIERLQAQVDYALNHYLKSSNFTKEELLAEAWIQIKEERCTAERIEYAVRKADRSLRQQSQETKTTIYAEQLRHDGDVVDYRTVAQPQSSLIPNADDVYDLIQDPTEHRMFRMYVDNFCNVDAVAEEFDMPVLDVIDVVQRIKKQLKEALLNE